MKGEAVRFLVVGGIGFVVDAGLVYVLSHLGISPIVARIPAIGTAILVTWILNRRLTFEVKRPGSTRELLRYLGVATVSALLNFALYSALVTAGVRPVIAVAAATVALVAFSFFGYRIFAFELRR